MGNALLNVAIPTKRATTKPHTAPPVQFGVTLDVPTYLKLSAAERAVFDDVCRSLPAHLHQQIDALQVVELARVITEMERTRKVIASHGAFEIVTLTNGSTRRRPSPEVAFLDRLARQRHRLIGDLGLGTATRSKLTPGGSGKKLGAVDRWAV